MFASVRSNGLGTPEERPPLATCPEAAGVSGALSSGESWSTGLSSDSSCTMPPSESLESAGGGGEGAWRAAPRRLARWLSISGLDGSGGEAGGDARRTCFFVRAGAVDIESTWSWEAGQEGRASCTLLVGGRQLFGGWAETVGAGGMQRRRRLGAAEGVA